MDREFVIFDNFYLFYEFLHLDTFKVKNKKVFTKIENEETISHMEE